MTTRPDHDAPVTDDAPRVEHSDDPDEIRVRIEETRHDLGETVEALAAKVDVKAQMKDKVEVAKGKATEVAGTAQEQVRRKPGVFIGAAVAMAAALVTRRRLKGRRKKQ